MFFRSEKDRDLDDMLVVFLKSVPQQLFELNIQIKSLIKEIAVLKQEVIEKAAPELKTLEEEFTHGEPQQPIKRKRGRPRKTNPQAPMAGSA